MHVHSFSILCFIALTCFDFGVQGTLRPSRQGSIVSFTLLNLLNLLLCNDFSLLTCRLYGVIAYTECTLCRQTGVSPPNLIPPPSHFGHIRLRPHPLQPDPRRIPRNVHHSAVVHQPAGPVALATLRAQTTFSMGSNG